MKIAPQTLCYVRFPESDPLAAQVDGRIVTAIRPHSDNFWDIEPRIVVTLSRRGRDRSGQMFQPGTYAVGALPDTHLVPIAGPHTGIAREVCEVAPVEVPA